MPEATPGGSQQPTPAGGPQRDLTPAEVERLADLVYRLLRDDLIRMRERAGGRPSPWR